MKEETMNGQGGIHNAARKTLLLGALLLVLILAGLAITGLGHLNEGPRSNERQRIATAIAALSATQLAQNSVCYLRPGEPGVSNPALALVIRNTTLGVVTFLYELGNGTPTFLLRDIPENDLADYYHDPRAATYWTSCSEEDKLTIFDKLLRALKEFGLSLNG